MEEVTTIPFEVTRVPDNTKPVGFELVVQDGVEGKRIVTKDEESGQIISDKTTHPKNQVVYFGTVEITPEAPQEEVPEETPINTEVDTLSPTVPETPNPVQPQGRDTEDGVLNKETNVNTKVLKKALLEAARLLVFAVPGILITVLTDNPSLGGSLGGTILLVLKSIDRSIHENPATPVKGLLPF